MKFATIDGTGAVTAFYDDSAAPPQGAVTLTEVQWQDWVANQRTRKWQGGALIAVAPPAPSPGQVFAAKVAAGITITSTGTPALNATFALDDITLTEIGSVARDSFNMGLPGGLATFIYPDINGTPRTFTAAQIQGCYKAMRDLMLNLNTAYATLAQGGTPTWPSQSATIV